MRPCAPFEKKKEMIKMPKYEIEISEVLQRVPLKHKIYSKLWIK